LRHLRRVFQVGVLLAVIWLALGWGKSSFENFCPFGGIESLYALVTSRFITCAISPWNFAVFFGVLGLTIAAKKSFCSWICPIGFLYELLGKVQRKLFKNAIIPPPGVDRWLRHLRYVVLVVVLYFTWKTGELIFRGYDPFYLAFSGIGHGTLGTMSLVILGVLVVSGLFIRMSWCRYLCPMSAVMDPFSRWSSVAIRRDTDLCIACGICDESCEHDLEPSRREVVSHRDCSNCLECLHACDEQGSLSLALHNPFRKTPA
jgi:polyferredoxin